MKLSLSSVNFILVDLAIRVALQVRHFFAEASQRPFGRQFLKRQSKVGEKRLKTWAEQGTSKVIFRGTIVTLQSKLVRTREADV